MKTNRIKAVIIDDEQGCVANLLFNLTTYCPDIEVVATGHTIADVADIIANHKIDVAFFDIELFDENILDFLYEGQKADYKIVFVTAYDKYAVKAFKVEALDYLLKPIALPDILDCYAKIRRAIHGPGDAVSKNKELAETPLPALKKVILKQSDKVYVIWTDDIYYLQARRFYTHVVFNFKGERKGIVTSKPISQLEKEYCDEHFFRVHKSFLINTAKISNIIKKDGVNIELDNGEIIPVAKRRVTEFLSYFDQKKA